MADGVLTALSSSPGHNENRRGRKGEWWSRPSSQKMSGPAGDRGFAELQGIVKKKGLLVMRIHLENSINHSQGVGRFFGAEGKRPASVRPGCFSGSGILAGSQRMPVCRPPRVEINQGKAEPSRVLSVNAMLSDSRDFFDTRLAAVAEQPVDHEPLFDHGLPKFIESRPSSGSMNVGPDDGPLQDAGSRASPD